MEQNENCEAPKEVSKPLEESKKVFESRGIAGQETRVERIKHLASEVHAEISTICAGLPQTEELIRIKGIAKTRLEESVMWAVKACSRTHS